MAKLFTGGRKNPDITYGRAASKKREVRWKSMTKPQRHATAYNIQQLTEYCATYREDRGQRSNTYTSAVYQRNIFFKAHRIYYNEIEEQAR